MQLKKLIVNKEDINDKNDLRLESLFDSSTAETESQNYSSYSRDNEADTNESSAKYFSSNMIKAQVSYGACMLCTSVIKRHRAMERRSLTGSHITEARRRNKGANPVRKKRTFGQGKNELYQNIEI